MCERPMHRLGGLYAGAGVALAMGQPWYVAAVSAGLAAFAAPGPDVDMHKWWRRLDKWVPDEWLGEGGPLQHRGITHWVGWPLIVGVLMYVSSGHGPWFAWAVLAGWASHIVLDFCFGKASRWDHRAAGVPLLPWSHHVGLGLDAGGWFERRVLVPVLAVAGPAVLAWALLGPLVRTATTAWEATR